MISSPYTSHSTSLNTFPIIYVKIDQEDDYQEKARPWPHSCGSSCQVRRSSTYYGVSNMFLVCKMSSPWTSAASLRSTLSTPASSATPQSSSTTVWSPHGPRRMLPEISISLTRTLLSLASTWIGCIARLSLPSSQEMARTALANTIPSASATSWVRGSSTLTSRTTSWTLSLRQCIDTPLTVIAAHARAP